MTAKKTRLQFEIEQASRAGVSVAEFREQQPYGPCDCGEPWCEGWWMGPLMGHGTGRPMGILTNPELRYVT